MKLVWITGRDINIDLAGTTEFNLVSSLTEMGIDILLIHPGEKIQSVNISSQNINKSNITGFNTITGAINIRKLLLRENEILKDCDSILVDWRYVWLMRKFLKSIKIPWFIIDRGPPINNDLFSKIQKIIWKSSWKFSDINARGGFIVSEKHKDFIIKRIALTLDTVIIPAGSYKNIYLGERRQIMDEVGIAYIGKIDKKRDIESIIRLSKRLTEIKINHRIDFYGEGDFEKELVKEAIINKNIHFKGQISRTQIPKVLAKKHIGVMPMPKIEIWEMGSPLKLAEYLSAGLLIIGPKHSGNQILGDEEWSLLTEGSDWTKSAAVEIMKNMDNWDYLSNSAIKSQTNLDWKKIASDISDEILSKI